MTPQPIGKDNAGVFINWTGNNWKQTTTELIALIDAGATVKIIFGNQTLVLKDGDATEEGEVVDESGKAVTQQTLMTALNGLTTTQKAAVLEAIRNAIKDQAVAGQTIVISRTATGTIEVKIEPPAPAVAAAPGEITAPPPLTVSIVPVAELIAGQDLTITANIANVPDGATVKLKYRVGTEGDFKEVTRTSGETGNNYPFTIPKEKITAGATITWYIEVTEGTTTKKYGLAGTEITEEKDYPFLTVKSAPEEPTPPPPVITPPPERNHDDLTKMFIGLRDGRRDWETALEGGLNEKEAESLGIDTKSELYKALKDGKITKEEARELGIRGDLFRIIDNNMRAGASSGDEELTLSELLEATAVIKRYAEELDMDFNQALAAYRKAESFRNVKLETLGGAKEKIAERLKDVTPTDLAAVRTALSGHVQEPLITLLIDHYLKANPGATTEQAAAYLLRCEMATMTGLYEEFGFEPEEITELQKLTPFSPKKEVTEETLLAWLGTGKVEETREGETPSVEEPGKYDNIANRISTMNPEKILDLMEEMEKEAKALGERLTQIDQNLRLYAATEGEGRDARIKIDSTTRKVVLTPAGEKSPEGNRLAEEYLKVGREYVGLVSALKVLYAEVQNSSDAKLRNEARLKLGEYQKVIDDADAPALLKAKAHYALYTTAALQALSSATAGTTPALPPVTPLQEALEILRATYAEGAYTGLTEQKDQDEVLQLYATMVLALIENSKVELPQAIADLNALAAGLNPRITALAAKGNLSEEDRKTLFSLRQALIQISLMRQDFTPVQEQALAIIEACNTGNIPAKEKEAAQELVKRTLQMMLQQAAYGFKDQIEATKAILEKYEAAGWNWEGFTVPSGGTSFNIQRFSDLDTVLSAYNDQWPVDGAVKQFEGIVNKLANGSNFENVNLVSSALRIAYMYPKMNLAQRQKFFHPRTGIRSFWKVRDSDPLIVQTVLAEKANLPVPQELTKCLAAIIK